MVEQRGMLNNQLSEVCLQGRRRDRADRFAKLDISVWQFLAAPLFGARWTWCRASPTIRSCAAVHVQAQGIAVLERCRR